MSERMAWGRWDCTRCGNTDISGQHKRCPKCGDPREQDELDAMRPPSAEEFARAAITAPEERALAESGADWICGFCGTTNRGTDSSCASCAGNRQDKVGEGSTGPVAETRATPPAEASKRGAGTLSRYWRRSTRARKVWTVVGAVVAVLIAVVWWGSLTKEKVGQVTALQWEHTTQLQRWGDVTRGQWGRPSEQAEVKPVGARGERPGIAVTSCYQKHHSDESYACGTESYTDTESYSCGTTESCSTVSNGNGSFSQKCSTSTKYCSRNVTKTRTKYCTRPIYREWCDYRTQDWVPANTLKATGEGHAFRWESLTATGDLERVQKWGTYRVISGLGEETAAHTLEVTREEYDGYEVGDAMIFTVKNIGGIDSVRRAK